MATISFRRAVLADLPGIVTMLADDDLGHQREDPSIPVNPKYLASFAAIDRDSNQLLTVVVDSRMLAQFSHGA